MRRIIQREGIMTTEQSGLEHNLSGTIDIRFWSKKSCFLRAMTSKP